MVIFLHSWYSKYHECNTIKPMNISSSILYLIIFIGLVSCSTPVDIDLEEQTPEIVVNSLFTNSKPIELSLSHTTSIYNTNTHNVVSANIVLINNNSVIDTFYSKDSGKYISNIIPTTGVKYEVKVSNTNFPVTTAEDYIPEKTEIIKTTRTDNAGHTMYGAYSKLKIEFQDDVSIENFYELILYYKYNSITDTLISTDTLSGIAFLQCDDPVVTAEIDSENGMFFQYLLFADKLINGKKYALVLN